ncbi:hypothetical protein RvY_06703 [Ramazzottius varieornatus]|uniref:Uncharacterized protein n=1 Tax=Ramazzottius varieornatus TaxID=947166 RepID=A0A1D1UZH1_RAMVA|nr:hypothetical protein RvY_06703 [Ramazzottius varieornatus]
MAIKATTQYGVQAMSQPIKIQTLILADFICCVLPALSSIVRGPELFVDKVRSKVACNMTAETIFPYATPIIIKGRKKTPMHLERTKADVDPVGQARVQHVERTRHQIARRYLSDKEGFK